VKGIKERLEQAEWKKIGAVKAERRTTLTILFFILFRPVKIFHEKKSGDHRAHRDLYPTRTDQGGS